VVGEDLRDTGRLLELHRQAVRAGLAGASEHDRLRFVAAANHARVVGKSNPCGLFVRLVKGGLWRFLTQVDEDAASVRLKRYLYGAPRGPEPRGSGPGPCADPGLSEDAVLVREVRASLARVGYRGDAFYALKREKPDWTRERWDRATAELARGFGGGARGMGEPGWAPGP
jgi:transposase